MDANAAPARSGRRWLHTGVVSNREERRLVSIGGGVKLPYPEPTSEAATKIGKANPRTGTRCEVALRSALHAAGLRYRKDHLLRVGDVRVRPDVVFTRAKVAVFVDGCFWHGCPQHGRVPKSNQAYWVPKLERNQERDALVDRELASHGWEVVRIWEHEDPLAAAAALRSRLQQRR